MNIFLLILILLLNLFFYVIYLMAGRQNGNLLLGVTLPVERMEDRGVQAIVSRYRKKVTAVMGLTAALSIALYLLIPREWMMLVVFAMVLLPPFVIWLIYVRDMRRLYAYKQGEQIVTGQARVITIDTVVTRMQGRQAISLWWYLIPIGLSLIPIVWHLQGGRFTEYVPFAATFVPLIMCAASILMHLIIVRDRSKVVSSDTQLNQLANRVYQRSWNLAAFQIALVSAAVFLLLFVLVVFRPGISVEALLLSFLAAILALLLFHFVSVREQTNALTRLNDRQEIITDDDFYWIKGYYDNPDDPRMTVPKRSGVGSTVNFGNWKGRLNAAIAALLTVLLIGVFLGMFLLTGMSDFSLYRQGDTIYTEAPFYNTSFGTEEIEKVEVIDELTGDGMRTNGYGDGSINMGHFRLEEYGSVMLYQYIGKPPYLVITLKDRVVIINGRTPEKTQKMAEMLRQEER